MKTIIKTLFMALLLTTFLWSCSPSTRITASWVDPEARNQSVSGKSIFIASLTRNLEVRSKLEDALAEQATARQITAVKSTSQFRPDFYQNLEANLYSLDNNQLIWSAQTATMNPGSIDGFVSTYPQIIFDQLIKDGVLMR